MLDIPALPGSYALFLTLEQPTWLQAGRLRETLFPAGEYVYLGSAGGPGGLRARLGRHVRGQGRPRWHIDYLRAVAEVRAFIYQLKEPAQPAPTSRGKHSSQARSESRRDGPLPPECAWSQALLALAEASCVLPGFGASDCRSGCCAHLVYFPQPVELSSHLLPDFEAEEN